jgi:hypothetical protein
VSWKRDFGDGTLAKGVQAGAASFWTVLWMSCATGLLTSQLDPANRVASCKVFACAISLGRRQKIARVPPNRRATSIEII